MLNNLTIAVIVLAAAVAILLVITIINTVQLRKISRNSKNGNLAQSIEMYYDNVEALTKNITDMSERFKNYEIQNALALKRCGIVHYNAFGDISGNMSFSMALLNDTLDGFILTSLYGHESCSLYFREIYHGKPSVTISGEEQEALSTAMSM